MIVVLNRQKDGFVERKSGGVPGRYPFNVGSEAVSPAAGDFVFVEPAHRGVINTLFAQRGLAVGRLMGGHEYLIVLGAGWRRKSDGKWFPDAEGFVGVSGQLLGSDGLVGYNEIRTRGDVGSAESPYPVAQCPDCAMVLLPRDIDVHRCQN